MAYIDLQTISVASPCSAEWVDMTGNDNVRHCADCRKNVYNLSSLTHAEISDLILEKEGNLCIRFYRRHDGTMLTADCPRGLRAIRISYIKTRAKVLAVVIGMFGAVTGLLNSCRSTNATKTIALIPKKPADSVLHPRPQDSLSKFTMGDYVTTGITVHGSRAVIDTNLKDTRR